MFLEFRHMQRLNPISGVQSFALCGKENGEADDYDDTRCDRAQEMPVATS